MGVVTIRLGQVLERVPYGRSTILSMVRAGSFPAPIRLGQHAVAWVSTEVDQWLEARIAERDAGLAGRVPSPNKRKAAPAPVEPAPVALPAPRRRRRSVA